MSRRNLRISSRTPKFESLEDRRVLATLTVNVDWDSDLVGTSPNSNNYDTVAVDDGNLTLREAIAVVNDTYNPTLADGDLLQIDTKNGTEPVGINDTILFNLPVDKHTITLGIGENGTLEFPNSIGDLRITEAVTIDAEGQSIVIDAGHGLGLGPNPDPLRKPFNGDGFRIFNIEISTDDVDDTKEVELIGLAITGGDVDASGGGVRFVGNANTNPMGETKFTLKDSIIAKNHAWSQGGGIFISNHLGTSLPSTSVKIEDSFIQDNLLQTPLQAGGHISGGGIHIQLENTRAELAKITVKDNDNLANLSNARGRFKTDSK